LQIPEERKQVRKNKLWDNLLTYKLSKAKLIRQLDHYIIEIYDERGNIAFEIKFTELELSSDKLCMEDKNEDFRIAVLSVD